MASTEQTNESNPAGWAAVGMAMTAGAVRLLRLWPNCTPVGALGLFAGAKLRLWQAFAVSMAVMLASDVLLTAVFHRPGFDPWVYGSFAVDVLLGRWLLRKGSAWRVPLVSVFASLQFFVVTNFGVWFAGGLYPKTLAGLGLCYLAALPFTGDMRTDGTPFFFGTVLGDLAFSALFFGLYAAIIAILGRRKASQPV